ncbi:MAG: DinB family protein [Saprospiraceae bacterium]|nr:DinB family protein [Saprospiraceae bacterium]
MNIYSLDNFRDNGAIGALLDEYERAISDLNSIIQPIDQKLLTLIIDPHTKDEDCRSIQSILTHIVRAGYGYAVSIYNHQGKQMPFKQNRVYDDAQQYIDAINEMFQFTLSVFDDFPNLELEQYNPESKILTRWGQRYDVEQLMEHAIVHILRHRRQIERFQLKVHTK